jgi:hypothetical protein
MTASQTKYRIAYRNLNSSEVYYMRKEFTERNTAESEADNYNAGTSAWNPVLHWVEPVEDNPQQ